jgi:hypothetical protein
MRVRDDIKHVAGILITSGQPPSRLLLLSIEHFSSARP